MTEEVTIDSPRRSWIYDPELTYSETGRVWISDMISNSGLSRLLGLPFEGYQSSNSDPLKAFLNRFTRDPWTFDVKSSTPSIVVMRSDRKTPEMCDSFRLPHSMNFVNVDSTGTMLIMECVREGDRDFTMKIFITKKYIESIILRPTPVIHRAEVVDIGTVTVTPYDDKANAFFVDFDLADTRLLNHIAEYKTNYRFRDKWKEVLITSFKSLDRSVFLHKTYLFTDPMGLAMAVFDAGFLSTEPLIYAKVTEVDRVNPVMSDEYGHIIRLSSSNTICSPVRSFLNTLEDFKNSQQPADEA